VAGEAMTPYVVQEVFNAYELELFERAQHLVTFIPAKFDDEWVRCHEVARAVAKLLGIPPNQVADGWYGQAEHSWIWTSRKEFGLVPNVLDTYAIGRVPQVQLIHSSPYIPFEYRRGDPRSDIKLRVVNKLVSIMRREHEAWLLGKIDPAPSNSASERRIPGHGQKRTPTPVRRNLPTKARPRKAR